MAVNYLSICFITLAPGGMFTVDVSPLAKTIDLNRITRCNLRIVRVVHFWKCYGSEASKS